MADRIYLDGIIIKEWGEHGSMNVSINLEQFREIIAHNENNGWLNLTIYKRKTPSDKGVTHKVAIDDYKPRNR